MFRICSCYSCENVKNAAFGGYPLFYLVDKKSTGTRIRTQIKGFGDPYATVAPCPCVSNNSKELKTKSQKNPFDF
jgi:hypothetical protein